MPLGFVILLSDIPFVILYVNWPARISPFYNFFLFVIPYYPLGYVYESVPICPF